MTLSSYSNAHLKRLRLAQDAQRLSIFYRIARRFTQVMLCSMWRVRVFNRQCEPESGGVLYLSNHQSFLDPPLIGFALQRPMNFMARASLFSNPLFGKMISKLNAFPVKTGTSDIGAFKEALRRLKGGGQLALFPEGTRSTDARIGPFLPGAAMLAQRAAKWTVPVLIDGAAECWPRKRKLPLPGSIVVQYGQPISQAEARKYDTEDFVKMVRGRLIDIQTDVRRRVGRPELTYDD